MPELPEVETTVRGLNRVLVDKTITGVWTDYESPFHTGKDNIKNPKFFTHFKKTITGAVVRNVERRAKNILIHLDPLPGNIASHTILIHMKMTGHLLYGHYKKIARTSMWVAREKGPLQDPFNRFIHFVLTLSDGKQLAFSDMRKFAKVTLLPTESQATHADLKHLGPEPLDKAFTFSKFRERLALKPRGKIKQVLMDQSVIAGIGNIYSDEILWVAGIHPESRVEKIFKSKDSAAADLVKKMFVAMQEILTRSIGLGGDSMSDYRNLEGEKGGFHPYHNAYMQHGKPCTKRGCKGTIRKMKVGGRSAHFCDTHQKLGKN